MLRVLQIVQQLLQQNRHATKRDVYYSDPAILKGRVNQALNDICIHFQCSRSSLHVVMQVSIVLTYLPILNLGSAPFCKHGNLTKCINLQGLPVPVHISQVSHICSGADYILLVEKETGKFFQRLVNDKFCGKNRCILLTGKGYPDVATRSFLRRLTDELHLPVYALMDGDPYGLDILSVYRFGSLTMAFDAEVLAVPEIFWLGVHLSDCLDFHIPEECLLPLTERDKKKADALLSRSYLKHLAPDWWTKLAEFRSQAVKLEIEAISAASFSLLADHYIQSKIQGKGYV
ncbi:unnamed protein product [Sphagnum balticum]